MIFARDHVTSTRKRPTPGASAVCSLCGSVCVAKCGKINVWHWAHKSVEDCDPWSEGETPWHLWWKTRAEDSDTEVIIPPHRADIIKNGTVIELQNSTISPEEISERERFYRNMIWLFNGEPFRERFRLRPKDNYYTFRWKHPRRSYFTARKPIFIDLDPHVFEVKKLYGETPCGGWGYLHTRQAILKRFGLREFNPIEAASIARVDVDLSFTSFQTDSLSEAARWIRQILPTEKSRRENAFCEITIYRSDGKQLPAAEAELVWNKTAPDL